MPRRPRKLDRDDGIARDASLIVIASEDTHAVERYFQQFHTTKVQIEVLPTEEGRSSPEAVVQRLDAYAEEFQIGGNDELWACIDLDHWASGGHVANLTRVITLCRQKGYRLAISSPCFELWIYLHFAEAPTRIVSNCRDMVELLRQLVPGYTKQGGLPIPITADHVHAAIARAQAMPDAMLLERGVPATGMHALMTSLGARQTLRLREARS